MSRIVLLTALITIGTLVSASPAGSEDLTVDKRIDAYLQQLTSKSEFSGNVLVARDGKVLFEHSYGYANVEFGVPNTPATRFRIFSMTKQFTAATITLLVQRKLLRPDDSVVTYLPQLPASWRAVTVRELLEHTSGLPQLEDTWVKGFNSSTKVRTQLQDLNAVLPELRKYAPIHQPGMFWQYNNFGYDLLGCVVEAVSREPYTRFVRENLLAPSGMLESGFVGQAPRPNYQEGYYGPAVVAQMAQGYNGAAGLPQSLQSSWAESYASAGAGDMYATARDILSYARALENQTVLSAASQRMMVDGAFHVTKDVYYGFGWIVKKAGRLTYIHHSGGDNGYTSDFAIYPEEHTVIIVLGNFGFADPESIRKNIAAQLFK